PAHPPIRSLQGGTRAHALRCARTCYDHLAGHLGVAVMRSLLDRRALVGGDGRHRTSAHGKDRLARPGRDVDYRLTDSGRDLLDAFGVRVPISRRRRIAYCVDWTEQRHHLGGAVGAALLSRLEELDWARREPRKGSRALDITDAGRVGFLEVFGIDTDHLVV